MSDNKPAPKPQAPKKATAKEGAIFDAVLDEATIKQHAETKEAPAVEVEEVTPAKTEKAPAVEKGQSSAPTSSYAVVGDGEKDEVSLSKVSYKNIVQKKSLSVHHIQRRLNERGYTDAFLDKDGFYGDKTKDAMAEFQKDNGLSGDGFATLESIMSLFENDSNVTVTP